MQDISPSKRQKPQFNFRELLILENDEELDQNLLCQLCQELVLEPQECQECQNLFCHKCIQTWLQQKNQCVFKCPSQPPKIKDPHKMVKTALGALKFACPNSQKGCNKRLNQQKIMAHMNECEMASLNCPNKGCNFIGLKSDIEKHVPQCMFIQMKCQNCFSLLNVQEQQTHNCFHELIKTINELRKENNQLRQNNKNIINAQQKYKKQVQTTIENLQNNLNKIVQNNIVQMENQENLDDENGPYKPVCDNNHDLNWTKGKRFKCSGCNFTHRVIHYICEKCSTKYCVICKPPIISDNTCPLKHSFEFIPDKQVSNTSICDMCEREMDRIPGSGALRDKNCDMDFCSDCFKYFE